jgi:hypothetical protein
MNPKTGPRSDARGDVWGDAPGDASLLDALAALRHDLAQHEPPAAVHDAVQRALPRREAIAERKSGWRGWALLSGAPTGPTGPTRPTRPTVRTATTAHYAGAVACALLLVTAALWVLRPGVEPRATEVARAQPKVPGTPSAARSPARSQTPSTTPTAELAPAMPFVPLVSAARLRELAAAHDAARDGPAWLLTAEVPQQRLAAMGLPFDPERAAESLRAELLVAGTGEVLAVRLLY